MKRIVLLDVSAIMYRAFYGNMNFRTKNEPTGAVYGFTNTLLSIIKEFSPDYIGAAQDIKRAELKRSEIYKDYKNNREAMPEDLLVQVGRIEEVLDIVDLRNTAKKRASQFSMGMKQRLGIAIALLNNPKLLILDEPTNGLDPFGIQELRNLISSFPKKGITVILSSHILSEVSQVVDKIAIINEGKLLFEGMPDKDENLEEFFTNTIVKNKNM